MLIKLRSAFTFRRDTMTSPDVATFLPSPATMLPPRLFTAQRLYKHTRGSGWSRAIVLLSLGIAAQSSVFAQVEVKEKAQGANEAVVNRQLQRYDESIKPILKQGCFDCHSGDNVEGNFRADQLDPDLVNGEDIAWWLRESGDGIKTMVMCLVTSDLFQTK